MQASDKNNNSFDQEFFDLAWENMNDQLDQEMPVKRKRRRFLFWFFLMTGCLAGMIFWVGNLTSSEVEAEIPLASKTILLEEAILDFNNKVKESKIVNEEPIFNKENTKTINKSQKQNIWKTPIKNTLPSKSIIFSQQKNQTEDSNSTPEKTPSLNLGSINSLEPILYYSIDPVKLEIEKKYLASSSTGNICPPKRAINFGLQGGMMYDFSSSGNSGLTTGINVHFPIGNKWGIQTGLTYSLLPKSKQLEVSQNYEAIINETNTPLQDLLNADLSLYSVESSVTYDLEKIHFVEIPLLATYKLNRKWNFKAGLNWSKELRSLKAMNDSSVALIDNDPNSELLLENFRTSNVPNISNKILKDDFVSGVLGISFYPTKKLSLNLFYYQQFQNNSSLDDSAIEFSQLNTTVSGGFDPTMSSDYLPENDIYRSLRLTVGYRF